jgi:acyl-CoA reductase-like NAD-dependent aldehyde dehydrogenase
MHPMTREPSLQGDFMDAKFLYVDPAAGEAIASVAFASADDAYRAISATRKTFDHGSTSNPKSWAGFDSPKRRCCHA